MANGITNLPVPVNEPVRDHAPGSSERGSLKGRLREMLAEKIEIPVVIGGEEIRTGRTGSVVCPHDHAHVLATYHAAGPDEVERAIEAGAIAWREWSELGWEARAGVFLRAAELLAGPWRDTLNAASMLGQSKNVYQAEIDAACELIDFWRFNPAFMRQIYTDQPASARGIWDRAEYRALEGFVFAVSPFNFTSIAGNLPTAPAMMGNVALWKPATTSLLSSYYIMRLLEEAGLPPGVISFLPGPGRDIGGTVLERPELAGVHFTGSTGTFQHMWRTIGQGIERYRSYPRIVGETGGKDFVFAHASADEAALGTALVRGAFEYQGQKCSAASRAYVPASLWPGLRDRIVADLESTAMGPPTDFRNFVCAVIDRASFENISGYLDEARSGAGYEIVAGGEADASTGYFVQPTVVRSTDPRSRLMAEEIFGPVLTIFVYADAKLDETIALCDATSPYALTGAVFARDRAVIADLTNRLRHAAGNFYVNDKPTGAVVGQQPFGGARASGTNDKAGSMQNLLRWTSARSIKETFVPPTDYRYPHLDAE